MWEKFADYCPIYYTLVPLMFHPIYAERRRVDAILNFIVSLFDNAERDDPIVLLYCLGPW